MDEALESTKTKGKIVNERHIRALYALASANSEHDTKRKPEMLAASFVRDNLAYALGLEVQDPELVMDDTRVSEILDRSSSPCERCNKDVEPYTAPWHLHGGIEVLLCDQCQTAVNLGAPLNVEGKSLS